jgi:hypothetical protein
MPPVETCVRYFDSMPSLTIWPAIFWCTTATSTSTVAEFAFFCASRRSQMRCEPASPGPVPTARTFTPGLAFSNIGPRNSVM